MALLSTPFCNSTPLAYQPVADLSTVGANKNRNTLVYPGSCLCVSGAPKGNRTLHLILTKNPFRLVNFQRTELPTGLEPASLVYETSALPTELEKHVLCLIIGMDRAKGPTAGIQTPVIPIN